MHFRSQDILNGPEWLLNRGTYKTMGYSDDDLSRPLIAVVNSWNQVVPGHYNLREVAEYVRSGIYRAGGTPVEFGILAPCDGIAQGHDGMHYILPARELVAHSIEVMIQAHRLDGMVLLGSCDKIVPGMLMAAARLDLPAILIAGGPMLGGREFDGRASDMTTLSEAVGMLKSGRISEAEFEALEDVCGPSCGSCAYLGTANTMCSLAEAMGMSLPGSALIPAVYADRMRAAQATGQAIVELVRRGITARQIINSKSLDNAIRVCMAIGGSTNAALHLPAIAYEAGVELGLDRFDQLSRETPYLAKLNPASKYNMVDFYQSGGIPQVMTELGNLLHLDALTVTGKTVEENLAAYRGSGWGAVNREVIRTVESPFRADGGLAVLRGNLAPAGAIAKPAAIDPAVWTFTGTARVFDSEEQAEEAILSGRIRKGDVVVIRYEGPKGGPGMREMYKAMKYLYGLGLAKHTALVTDGRFSGTNNGCFVGHVSPEAASGGPLAVVEEGDRITVDIPNRRLELHVDEREIQRRLSQWKPPAPKFQKGYLALYERLVSSADQGAIIKF
ncbi:MAG: dihydroxy-acid dehydratase [Clostridia bacterium]|nr:dihydroxy-acid dehydratase [Clostridia bacterium]